MEPRTWSPKLARTLRSFAHRFVLIAIVLAWCSANTPLLGYDDDFEQPPIEYSKTVPHDRISILNQSLPGDLANLPKNAGLESERLRRILKSLDVPIESQLLVFSRTSLQRNLIRPSSPRAIYFSDDVYLGWVPGGAVEVTAYDPKLGATFYTLDQLGSTEHFQFHRSDQCMECHARVNRGVPGLLARSVYPDFKGDPIFSAGTVHMTPATPWENRFGGWYLTGNHGSVRHLGNSIGSEIPSGAKLDRDAGANLASLTNLVSLRTYLSQESDLVAALVFLHQVSLHNALLHAAQQTRILIYRQQEIRKALGEPPESPPSGSTQTAIESLAEGVLPDLLSLNETPMPPEGVRGSPGFLRQYTARARHDRLGRHLRELDLQTRLFRYRCSPLIYSSVFSSLPTPLRTQILRRLEYILTDRSPQPPFDRIPPGERQKIREILKDTLEGF